MNYLGDFAAGSTIRLMWNAFAVAGESITRGTNGSIRIYKNNSNVERTSSAGITDTEDFDGLTGLNHIYIDTSNNTDPGFYAPGNDYFVVLQGAVIDGKTINAVLGTFSIENRSLQNRIPAALVSGRIDASVGAMAANVIGAAAIADNTITSAKIAADAITAAKIAPDAIGASELAADAVAEIQNGLATAAALAAAQGDLTALAGRLTAARAGYLDNLNVGGAVASQADIIALNQSASRRLVLSTVGQYEKPDSGSSEYTVELRTFDGDGAAVNAGSTPSLAATGKVSGDLSANLSTASNPAAGVYRWTYSVAFDAASEEVRFDASATLAGSVFTISAYTQATDAVSATWTATDAAHLTAIFDKLPSNPYLAGTTDAAGDALLDDSAANHAVIANGLAAYNAPTNNNLTSVKNEINTNVLINRNDIDLVKLKTDQLVFTGGKVKASLDGETVGANLIEIMGSPQVDGMPIAEMFRNIIAALQGDVDRSGNTFSFKNRNGTVVFSYTVSNTGRVEAP